MRPVTLYELITGICRGSDGSDLDDLTEAVFDKIDLPDEFRVWFRPMVRNMVSTIVRGRARRRAKAYIAAHYCECGDMTVSEP